MRLRVVGGYFAPGSVVTVQGLRVVERGDSVIGVAVDATAPVTLRVTARLVVMGAGSDAGASAYGVAFEVPVVPLEVTVPCAAVPALQASALDAAGVVVPVRRLTVNAGSDLVGQVRLTVGGVEMRYERSVLGLEDDALSLPWQALVSAGPASAFRLTDVLRTLSAIEVGSEIRVESNLVVRYEVTARVSAPRVGLAHGAPELVRLLRGTVPGPDGGTLVVDGVVAEQASWPFAVDGPSAPSRQSIPSRTTEGRKSRPHGQSRKSRPYERRPGRPTEGRPGRPTEGRPHDQ